MSYINKISYQIYKVEKKPYRQMLDELFSHLDVKQAVLRIVLFGEVVSKDDYMWRFAQFRRKAEEYFQGALPVVTFVAQKPLDAELVLEVHGYMSEGNDRLEYNLTKVFLMWFLQMSVDVFYMLEVCAFLLTVTSILSLRRFFVCWSVS